MSTHGNGPSPGAAHSVGSSNASENIRLLAQSQADPLAAFTGASEQFRSILPKGTPPELIAAIEDATCDVANQDALAAFEMSRDAALAHEAGHTIVATHEGLIIESVRIFARSVPLFGKSWGGWCAEKDSKEWTTGPDSSADEDLRRARVVIAGLAGEAIAGVDKPGSSLDELALSQLIGLNAAFKLADPTLNDEAYSAYAQQFWHEQLWRRTLAILCGNQDPFNRLVEHLHQTEIVEGGKLRAVLAQVRSIAP